MAKFDALWNYSDPQATRAAFEQVQRELGDEPQLQLELLTQLARTHSLVGEFAQAHQLLDEVEGQLSAETPTAHIRYLLERGRALRSAGDPAAAHPLFLQAFELSRTHGEDNYAVDAAHMVAIVVPADEQNAWHDRALAIAVVSDEPRARNWLGSLYNNIGWTHHDMGDFAAALKSFEAGLEWQCAHGSQQTRLIAQWAVARAQRSLGQVDAALDMQRAVLTERDLFDMPTGYAHEEIAELLLLKGFSAEAQPHFAAAHALLSQEKWLVSAEPDRIARLAELAGQA